MLVKVCGLTRPEDALEADKAGADLLGLIFAKSPRKVTKAAAKKIIAAVGRPDKFVAVFVDETFETISSVVQELGLHWVQLHGSETPELALELEDLGIHTIKAVSVRSADDIDQSLDYPCDIFLYDTYSKDLRGGTGQTFNWDLLTQRENMPRYFVSGGISTSNVGDVYEKLLPTGVDVSSSLETKPGIKSSTKIRSFLSKVQGLIST